ncbi:MAG: hypothetical protein ACRDZX_03705, partial [Acidimicrobiales bacterium]
MTTTPGERAAPPIPPLSDSDWQYPAPSPSDGQVPPTSPRWKRLRRRWKSALAVLVVVALAAAGGGYYLASRSSGANWYATAAAATGDIRETTSTTGTIEPATQAHVNFAVAGTVSHLYVASGKTVK